MRTIRSNRDDGEEVKEDISAKTLIEAESNKVISSFPASESEVSGLVPLHFRLD